MNSEEYIKYKNNEIENINKEIKKLNDKVISQNKSIEQAKFKISLMKNLSSIYPDITYDYGGVGNSKFYCQSIKSKVNNISFGFNKYNYNNEALFALPFLVEKIKVEDKIHNVSIHLKPIKLALANAKYVTNRYVPGFTFIPNVFDKLNFEKLPFLKIKTKFLKWLMKDEEIFSNLEMNSAPDFIKTIKAFQ